VGDFSVMGLRAIWPPNLLELPRRSVGVSEVGLYPEPYRLNVAVDTLTSGLGSGLLRRLAGSTP